MKHRQLSVAIRQCTERCCDNMTDSSCYCCSWWSPVYCLLAKLMYALPPCSRENVKAAIINIYITVVTIAQTAACNVKAVGAVMNPRWVITQNLQCLSAPLNILASFSSSLFWVNLMTLIKWQTEVRNSLQQQISFTGVIGDQNRAKGELLSLSSQWHGLSGEGRFFCCKRLLHCV